MSGKVRVLSVAVVLVCLTAGSVSALPLGPQPTEPGGIVALWDWFVGLFGGDGLLWEKAGSDMDPNGQPKAGGDMDPDGKPGSGND
jgi:hypothetical protein